MSRPVIPIPMLAAAILTFAIALTPVAAQDAAMPPSAAATPGAPFYGEGEAAATQGSAGPAGTPVVRWRHQTCRWAEGPSRRLAASGSMVYVPSDVLLALDAETGTERWRFRGRTRFESVHVDHDVVYASTSDGFLYAVDAATGSARWSFVTEALSSVSASVVGDGLVYVRGGVFASDTGSLQHALYAIDDATGAERWRLVLDGGDLTVPALEAGTLYAGGQDGYLYAWDAATGERRWRIPTPGGVPSSPAAADGTVYVPAGPELHAVDAANGTERWRFEVGEDLWTAPTVAAGGVYIESSDGHLYALDATTGTERWAFEFGDQAISNPAVAGGVVYLVSFLHGVVHALDATTGSSRWSLQTGVDFIWTSPVVLNGVVYFVGELDGYPYLLAIEESAGVVGTPLQVATAPDYTGGDPTPTLPPLIFPDETPVPNAGAVVTPVSSGSAAPGSAAPVITPAVPCQSRG
jgi:outer membrane protein assembly factor BamB